MKKINNQGFILAETLIVSVFLMLLFTMIYNNFYPLIGEYEKRERYDDVDGKYTIYWIKKIIESEDYRLTNTDIYSMNQWNYIRFNCSDVNNENNQRTICIDLVKSLEISGCDNRGDNCDIFITRYQIGENAGAASNLSFKDTIRNNSSLRKWQEACSNESATMPTEATAFANETSCGSRFFQECCTNRGLNSCTTPTPGSTNYANFYSDTEKTEEKTRIAETCQKNITKKVFTSSFKDYILSLPNYTKPHYTTGAAYRVIAVVHHEKDNNNFYSYSNMEVNK